MNKTEFLDEVRSRLNGLAPEDIEKAITYYDEAILDRVEDGMTEDEATADIGRPEDIANEILYDTPITKLVKAKVDKKKQNIETWEIVMIVLLAPIWIPVLIVLLSVILSVYIVLWSVIISLIATIIALVFGGIAIALAALTGLFTVSSTNTLGVVGLGILCLGVGLALIIPVKWACIGLVKAMKAFARWLKGLFINKKGDKE